MKIVIDETYDYAYNVWTYERGYVYDVEEVPRSGFYHYWHGANLDVIPHGNAHPASAKEIRSLPSGEALHKGEKTVTVSMDSILHHRDDEPAMSEAESVSGTPSRRKTKASSKAKKTPSEAKSATGKKPSTRERSAGKKLAEEKTSEPKKAVRKKTTSPSAGKTSARKSSSAGKASPSPDAEKKTVSVKTREKPSVRAEGKKRSPSSGGQAKGGTV